MLFFSLESLSLFGISAYKRLDYACIYKLWAMLKISYILTISLLTMFIQVRGQHSFVTDTTANKLGVRTAIKKTYFGDSKTPSMTYTEFYDNNGKLTKRTSYNNHFNSISICEYFFYNSKGQLVEERNIHYNQNDSTIDTQKYSYNSKGQLDSNFEGKIKYKYDGKGRVIERVEKTAKPSDLKTIYSYDSLGQLISVEEYFYNSMQQKRIFSYDDKGQILKETSSYYYSQKNIPNSEYENTFLYNEKGLVTTEYQKQTITSSGDKSDNRIYTYEYAFY